MRRNEKAPLKDETFRSAFSCVFCYKYSKSRDDVKQFVYSGVVLKIKKRKGLVRAPGGWVRLLGMPFFLEFHPAYAR